VTKPGSKRAPAPTFRCGECGATTLRWQGRCPECQAWGTVTEVGAPAQIVTSRGAVTTRALPIGDLDPTVALARPTGVSELDRVLGGGLVPGSVVLLAGEPGVGKSTLLLEVAYRFAGLGGAPALIVTGEESTAQVRMRAERTKTVHDQLFLAAENDLGAVLTHLDQVEPGLLVVDSVQTISTSAVEGTAGGVPQIRAVAASLIAEAKKRGIATVLVGHVTKDGSIAGPRVLEHLVDVVLHFEGDRHSSLRIIRATKNRFGAVDEIGCFEMREDGIAGLADPSGLFLSERPKAVPGTCVTVTLDGRRPLVTEIQALTDRSAGGSPRRSVSGLDSTRVAMLIAATSRPGKLGFGELDVYASTVGGLSATEPAADLAIAIAIVSAGRQLAMAPTLCAIGEVSLSGDIRRVNGLERRLAEAGRLGFHTAMVPLDHLGDVIRPEIAGVRTLPVATIDEALQLAANLSKEESGPRRPTLRAIDGAGRERPYTWRK
jgi:DNA repair protein RadA/Sms